MNVLEWIVLILFVYALYAFLGKRPLTKTDQAHLTRIEYINDYMFPDTVLAAVKARYPHLNDQQLNLVQQGLKQFFIVCEIANYYTKQYRYALPNNIAMPSQVVDVAWHAFIKDAVYDQYCFNAIGGYLHHKPAEPMQSPKNAQEGIRLAWRFACKKERIKHDTPLSLPLLFVIDRQLNIADGFKYAHSGDENPMHEYFDASNIRCAALRRKYTHNDSTNNDSDSSHDSWDDSSSDD